MQTNEQQRTVRVESALRERQPELADAYRAALSMLEQEPCLLGARIRVSFICHAMREVMAKSVRSFARSSVPRIKPSSKEQVLALPSLRAQHPDMDLGSGGPIVQIPTDVAAAFENLLTTAVQETRRIRSDVASLLTDDSNESHMTVNLWIQTNRFFVKWAHLHDDGTEQETLPNDNELRTRIAVFEELIDGVLTEFFALQHLVADILAEINSGYEDTQDA